MEVELHPAIPAPPEVPNRDQRVLVFEEHVVHGPSFVDSIVAPDIIGVYAVHANGTHQGSSCQWHVSTLVRKAFELEYAEVRIDMNANLKQIQDLDKQIETLQEQVKNAEAKEKAQNGQPRKRPRRQKRISSKAN
jgi:hypothetical protein